MMWKYYREVLTLTIKSNQRCANEEFKSEKAMIIKDFFWRDKTRRFESLRFDPIPKDNKISENERV